MPETCPVKLHKSALVFSKFCADMEMLPSYTPIFLIDRHGRIINKRKLSTSKDDFESIYNLVSDTETSFINESERACDAYAVKGKADDGKCFIVVSKDRDGFSRCVFCSYSEDKCIKLHDYIEKLCSYKDYLDSFASLAFSSMARLPVKRLFRMKISGAMELWELSSGTDSSEKRISFPIMLALEKLGAFASKANGAKIELVNAGKPVTSVVNVPEAFFKLAVSTMALVHRLSTNARVRVSVGEREQDGKVTITFSCKTNGKTDCIYQKALVSAFNERGMKSEALENDGEYTFAVHADVEKRAEAVISDVAFISKRIDAIVDDRVLSDMYFTISDI